MATLATGLEAKWCLNWAFWLCLGSIILILPVLAVFWGPILLWILPVLQAFRGPSISGSSTLDTACTSSISGGSTLDTACTQKYFGVE